MTHGDPQVGLDALVRDRGHAGALVFLTHINESLKTADVFKRDRALVLMMVLRSCDPRVPHRLIPPERSA